MQKYKISSAHIKVGSKIHLTDFYYGKMLFQNSYFAKRLALLVYETVKNEISTLDESIKKHKITIIGYGLYSELLLNNLSALIKGTHDNIISNTVIVNDLNLSIFSKDMIEEKVIIIVPIASTLSTATKISDAIQGHNNNIKHVAPPVNVLVVGHLDIKDIIDVNGYVINETAKIFWRAIDDKNKIIETVDGNNQKFIMYLRSEWQLPAICKYCLPNDFRLEQALFFTDKVSVTPTMIFTYPLGKDLVISNDNNVYVLSKDQSNVNMDKAVKYGHYGRGKNHYEYYIDTKVLLNNNIINVEKWCINNLLILKDRYNKLEQAKIYLFAPAHDSNALFTDIINRNIFSDVGTIYHYNPAEDLVENFKYFFSHIRDSQSFVFFVDDALCTGNTFFKLNSYMKTVSGFDKGFDGAFILMNRLTREDYDAVYGELKENLFTYAALDVPTIKDPDRFCYLCQEEATFRSIVYSSVLDFTRILSIYKASILKHINLDNSYTNSNTTVLAKKITAWETWLKENWNISKSSDQSARNYNRLYITHKIYNSFASDYENVSNCINTNEPLICIINYLELDYAKISDRVDLFKVITSQCFSRYKEVKKASLFWLLDEISGVIDKVRENQKTMNKTLMYSLANDYELIRYFKFLCMRLAKVKSTFLIRRDTLQTIGEMHDYFVTLLSCIMSLRQSKLNRLTDGLLEYDASALSDEQTNHFVNILRSFNLYYSWAVKNVVWDDEWKSVILEESLDALSGNDAVKKHSSFRSLLRTLRLENINPIKIFLDNVPTFAFAVKDLAGFCEDTFEEDCNMIKDHLFRTNILNNHFYYPFAHYITKSNFIENWWKDDKYLRYIIILVIVKLFIDTEAVYDSSNKSKIKIDYVLYLVSKLAHLDIKNNIDGCFLLVKYPALDENHDLIDEVAISGWKGKKPIGDDYDWKSSFSYKMINGYCEGTMPFPWTNYELVKDNDSYRTYHGSVVSPSDIKEASFLHQANHFLFLRLSKKDITADGNGVIVFYRKSANLIDETLLRTLLVIRNEINDFIEFNYNNDVFRSWVYEQKKKNLLSAMAHDFGSELDYLSHVAKKGLPSTEYYKYKLHHDIIKNKIRYTNLLKRIEDNGRSDVSNIFANNSIYKEKIIVEPFIDDVSALVTAIYSDSMISSTVTVNISTSTTITEFTFYRGLLMDLIHELILNAKKYRHNNNVLVHTITIAFDTDTSNSLTLKIRDNGKGINAINLNKLHNIGYIKPGGGLFMFSLLWKKLFNLTITFDSIQKEYFEVSIPLEGG